MTPWAMIPCLIQKHGPNSAQWPSFVSTCLVKSGMTPQSMSHLPCPQMARSSHASAHILSCDIRYNELRMVCEVHCVDNLLAAVPPQRLAHPPPHAFASIPACRVPHSITDSTCHARCRRSMRDRGRTAHTTSSLDPSGVGGARLNMCAGRTLCVRGARRRYCESACPGPQIHKRALGDARITHPSILAALMSSLVS